MNSYKINAEKLGLPSDSSIWCSTHPILAHKLTKLREKKTDCNVFRQLLREVTFYLGYEATHDLLTKTSHIVTPIGSHEGAELLSQVCLVPILRAGLGMVDPMLDLLPHASVHHIGMYRNKNSLLPIQYYNKLPKECDCDVAIVLEPMIATAGTISACISQLKVWGAPKLKILSAIASKAGLQELYKLHPEVEVYVAAIDDELTEEGFISPGLGDAGDRQFRTKGHAPSSPRKRPRHD